MEQKQKGGNTKVKIRKKSAEFCRGKDNREKVLKEGFEGKDKINKRKGVTVKAKGG